jgi:hypothetical protein
LIGTIWENITMESMRSICPDTENLCKANQSSLGDGGRSGESICDACHEVDELGLPFARCARG